MTENQNVHPGQPEYQRATGAGEALTAGAGIVDAIQTIAPIIGGGGVVGGIGVLAREVIKQRGENHRAEVNAARDIAVAKINAESKPD